MFKEIDLIVMGFIALVFAIMYFAYRRGGGGGSSDFMANDF